MDYKEWFATKTQTIQNNIGHDMNNEFGESCSLTQGRPSSWTYSSALSIGISKLRTEILLLLNEIFDFFPKTEENIEIIKNEITNIKNLGIDYIKSKKDNWISLHNSKFAVNINPSKSKIDEIDLDIFREIEKQIKLIKLQEQITKDKQKHDRKDTFWRIVTICISLIALGISFLSYLYSIGKSAL